MCKGYVKDGVLTITDIKLVSTDEDKSIPYKNMRDLRRAMQLSQAMTEFFSDVDEVFVEVPVGSQSARAMASYGICIGVLAGLEATITRVSAKDVKVMATGNPEASKKDMIHWATNRYPALDWLTRKSGGALTYTNANEHLADSIASLEVGLKGEPQ